MPDRSSPSPISRARVLVGFATAWGVLSLGLGLAVQRRARAALDASQVRALLAGASLAASWVAPVLPPALQADLDGRSTPPSLKRALASALQASGLRDVAVLDTEGRVLCDASGEALPGSAADMDLAAARADLQGGRAHAYSPRRRDFGLWEQSAVAPLPFGRILEADADPRQVSELAGITRGLLLLGLGGLALGGLALGGGLSVALAVGVLGRERALVLARDEAETVAVERVQLAGAIAHESRNALGAILGQAQWLQSRPELAEESKEAASKVAQLSGQLEAVMAALLDYSKPLSPHRSAVAARALLDDLKAELLRAQPSARVTIELKGLPELSCDPQLLAAALGNLGRNALEAGPPGGALRLVANVESRAWRFEVHDQGPGVPAGERESVFRPFQSRKPGGTGLGLALVAKVARAHGGRAWVEASDLGGARFVLEGAA
jgi:signal transduction histidine kinase